MGLDNRIIDEASSMGLDDRIIDIDAPSIVSLFTSHTASVVVKSTS
jgi:hypothetical protein